MRVSERRQVSPTESAVYRRHQSFAEKTMPGTNERKNTMKDAKGDKKDRYEKADREHSGRKNGRSSRTRFELFIRELSSAQLAARQVFRSRVT